MYVVAGNHGLNGFNLGGGFNVAAAMEENAKILAPSQALLKRDLEIIPTLPEPDRSSLASRAAKIQESPVFAQATVPYAYSAQDRDTWMAEVTSLDSAVISAATRPRPQQQQQPVQYNTAQPSYTAPAPSASQPSYTDPSAYQPVDDIYAVEAAPGMDPKKALMIVAGGGILFVILLMKLLKKKPKPVATAAAIAARKRRKNSRKA